MTITPKMTTAGNELRMSVPYELNRAFRAVFKTAEWDVSAKVFNAAATTQNRNKWERFLASVTDVVEALANADQVEATTEELERAAHEAELAVEKAHATLKDYVLRARKARERKTRAEEQLIEFAPVLERASAALTDVLVATAAVEDARDVVIAPALELYEFHGLERILSDFARCVGRRYSKEGRGRAQGEIKALQKDLKSIGFRLPAIDELVWVSLNRSDKIAQYVKFAEATMHSGLEVIDTDE